MSKSPLFVILVLWVFPLLTVQLSFADPATPAHMGRRSPGRSGLCP